MQKVPLLFLLGLVSIFPGCRPVSDTSPPESGSVVSETDEIAFEETEPPSDRYVWKPIVDYADITSNHPEDTEAVELLKAKGCWFSKPQDVHKSLGYPPSNKKGNLSDDDFQLIAKLPNLVKLQISKQPFRPLNLTADAFRHIRNHPELRIISILNGLSKEHFDDEIFVYLADMPKLQQLSINSFRLKGDSLKKLGDVRGLKSLSLYGCQFENEDWASLGELEKLESLELTMCDVSNEDIKFLGSLQNLRRLDLYSNYEVTRKSLPLLQKLPRLEALTLTHTGVHPVTLDDIAAFPELQSLSLLDVQPDFSRQALKARFPNLDYGEDD